MDEEKGASEPYKYVDTSMYSMEEVFQQHIDTKIDMIMKEMDLLKYEDVSVYSMDAMEELLATLNDLRQRKEDGYPHLVSVDETEPEYEQSKEYDV